jgi:Bacterial Ig-like domain
MRIDRYLFCAGVMALACAAGCAGDGVGLDQNGLPLSADSASGEPITADFQSIQDNVFTPICSKCHIGASAPEGLQLDAAHSFNLLVGVPSAEEPKLLRVKPGNPDESYMVLKIEGAAGIAGNQMPLGETPLPQATIAAIRQWISNGAPPAPAAAAPLFAVQTTAPLDSATVRAPLRRIVVTFSHDVDVSLVNETTVVLEKIERAGTGTPIAAWGAATHRIEAASTLAQHNSAVLIITPDVPLSAGSYRTTLRGSGGGALADLSATTLGVDATFEFTVESAP